MWDLLFLTASVLFALQPLLQGEGAMADAKKLAQGCVKSA